MPPSASYPEVLLEKPCYAKSFTSDINGFDSNVTVFVTITEDLRHKDFG